MNLTRIDDTIAKLTQSANPESRVLELWLDTSVARNAPASPSVYLVMHTFRPSSSLEAAVAKAIQTDDQGFVEDIQQDVSAQERVELFDVEPRWATGAGLLEAGGFTSIAEHLTQAARAGGALEHYAAIFLYWVGGLEQLAWIKAP